VAKHPTGDKNRNSERPWATGHGDNVTKKRKGEPTKGSYPERPRITVQTIVNGMVAKCDANPKLKGSADYRDGIASGGKRRNEKRKTVMDKRSKKRW